MILPKIANHQQFPYYQIPLYYQITNKQQEANKKKELQIMIILERLNVTQYIESCEQGCRKKKTDLDIGWLGVDKHEIPNHKPN